MMSRYWLIYSLVAWRVDALQSDDCITFIHSFMTERLDSIDCPAAHVSSLIVRCAQIIHRNRIMALYGRQPVHNLMITNKNQNSVNINLDI